MYNIYFKIIVQCTAGTIYNGKSKLCVDCEKGFYMPTKRSLDASSCYPCPSNTTTVTTASTSIDDCISM